MGRVINPDGAGKERTQLIRSVVLALRELMQQTETSAATRDLAAYLVLALAAIDQTVEVTVTAWEKRDYWLKADRFRMEWSWAGRSSRNLRTALQNEDWAGIAIAAAQVAQKLGDVDVPKRHKLGTPWVGALARLRQE